MIDKHLKKSDIIDMELYDFFDLLARANINEVLAIKSFLQDGRTEMLNLANTHKKEMFNFTAETFDAKKFDNELTYMVHCFAMAMYLDKKIELVSRREQDLTPDCFKTQLTN